MNLRRKNFIGGDLHHSKVFDKILSIGYEFETHELAKLSLLKDGKTLVNSSLNMRVFTDNKKDENYYHIKYPEKRPRLKFDEYVDIPFSAENISMHVINDLGNSDFISLLKSMCEPHKATVDRNKMYVYKTAGAGAAAEKTYNINFAMDNEIVQKNCEVFSGVEWLVTYYKPRQNKKIILETFIDAFLRIARHLQATVSQSGNIYFIGDGSKGSKIGELENRTLFNLPGTNLHYLQTYDTDDAMTQKGILDTLVVPQMTFRCNIEDAIEISKQIVKDVDNDEFHTLEKIDKMVGELLEAYNSSDAAEEHRIAISSDAGKKIRGYLSMIYYKLYAYVEFFSKTDDDNEDSAYLKNFLTFSARNRNDEYYFRAKELLMDLVPGADDEKAREIMIQIFDQPDIVGKYMYRSREDKAALREVLFPDDEGYGDPVKSYISYFAFFEEPSEEAQEQDVNDWFTASDMEFTSTYKIQDDTVLIENRLFVHELFDFIKRDQIKTVSHESNAISFRNLIRLFKHLTGSQGANADAQLTPRAEWREAAAPPRRAAAAAPLFKAPKKSVSVPKNMNGSYSPKKKCAAQNKDFNPKTRRCLKKCAAGTVRSSKTGRCIRGTRYTRAKRESI